MPWIDRYTAGDNARIAREHEKALKFIADLAVVFPQIRQETVTTFYGGYTIGPISPLAEYRVADIRRAAMADATQSDIELLASLRGVKRGVTVKVEGPSESVVEAVKRGVRKGTAATPGL